jgi:prepilin-type N-terminal cleavage/methylation domain-containing protein
MPEQRPGASGAAGRAETAPLSAKRTCAASRGFTVVELLLALVILAILLTSAALAIHASMQSYTENDKIAAATQTGRSVLERITREVRTAAAVNSETPASELQLIPPADGSGLQEIRYEHAGDTLYYHRTVNGTTTTYVLIGGQDDDVKVHSFSVTVDEWEGRDCTKNVTVWLEVEVDDHRLALRASASPRRNQLY